MRKTHLKLLQSMPIFGGIGEDVLDFLLEQATLVSMKQHEYFFHEGEQGASMFVLERGKVAVLRKWDGDMHPIKYFGQGDCFGEMTLIDLGRRSASIQALEDCVAIELSNATLMQLYQKDTEQFAMIYMNISRELSRRLRRANTRLFRLEAKRDRLRTQ